MGKHSGLQNIPSVKWHVNGKNSLRRNWRGLPTLPTAPAKEQKIQISTNWQHSWWGWTGIHFESSRVGSLNAPRHLRRARNVTNCSSFRLLHWFFKKQPKKQIKMAAIIQLKKTRDTRTSVKNNQTKEKLILSCGNAAVQRPHRHWNLIKIMA